MNDSLRRLGDVSREYQTAAQAFGPLSVAAAEAESSHKHQRARFITRARHDDPKASVAFLDAMADADDTIAALLRDRLVTAAVADAAKARLNQLREAVATGRTFVATSREADRLHAAGTDGAA